MTAPDHVPGMWHFFVRQQMAYIPYVALTDAGFFMDQEPVASVPFDDEESLVEALVRVIKAGNPVIRTPERSEYGEAVVSKAAGTGSWSKFERGASTYIVYKEEDGFRFPKMELDVGGGWVESDEVAPVLPLETECEELARTLVRIANEALAAARHGKQKPGSK